MLKIIICAVMALMLAIPSQAALLKGDSSQIIVAGRGTVKVKADEAYIMVGVERTEATAAKAQKITAQKMNNVLASLKKMGIPKDKMQTTGFRLNPKYEYIERKRTLVGYKASNQIKVTINKLDRLGKIIDTAITAGANNVSDVSFSVKDPAPAKKAALDKAFKAAREKAEIIAASSNQILGKIKSIQEAEARVIRPMGIRAFKAEAESLDTPILPGKIEVRGNLTVVYESKAKK